MRWDIIVIGAGIVGASTAWHLVREFPRQRILVLDKEAEPGVHQTGHNSGVIHAGVYYPPGSLKQRFCREGLKATKQFCRERGIAVDDCGKLIVATDALEHERLLALQERCRHNRLRAEYLSADGLGEREPRVQGVAALWVPETAVVDFRRICRAMLEEFRQRGGELRFNARVQNMVETSGEVAIETADTTYRAAHVVVCAGLMADRLVRMMGLPCGFRIVPFRGEFYRLHERCDDWFRHLIYPVPDPAMPFLGVHLTRTVDGHVLAGPNAVLGLRREAYRRADIAVDDLIDMLAFGGFWKVMARHWQAGLSELANAVSKRRYLRYLQRYCPALEHGDLLPFPAGVRAQAVNRKGELVQDFLFADSKRSLHVANAPSPAATSAIPIGKYVVERLKRHF